MARLVTALRVQGLRVFQDESAVDDFASISQTIRRELGRSLVLLAWYSEIYPLRRACQWELTAAFLAGQHEGSVTRRVLVVNPELGAEHIHPVELRDARHWSPNSSDSPKVLAVKVAEHVSRLVTPIGEVESLTPGLWLPAPPRRGTPGFAGRPAHLWRLHSELHPHLAPLLTGRNVPSTVIVRGGPGTGKTALTEEYAIRFSAAFPGGVFWLDLDQDADPIAAYAERVRTVSRALGVTGAESLEDYLNRLAIVLERRGEVCLWVVDGLPSELPEHVVRRLSAPYGLAATILTTRGDYRGVATVMDLDEPQVSPPLPSFGSAAVERAAAFDLQVELATRVGMQPLGDNGGLLREALDSLHELFQTTRSILRKHGPDSGRVHGIALDLLNDVLRPFLFKWHSQLAEYEEQRGPGIGAWQHERAWSLSSQMRSDLAGLRDPMQRSVHRLAGLSGVGTAR